MRRDNGKERMNFFFPQCELDDFKKINPAAKFFMFFFINKKNFKEFYHFLIFMQINMREREKNNRVYLYNTQARKMNE